MTPAEIAFQLHWVEGGAWFGPGAVDIRTALRCIRATYLLMNRGMSTHITQLTWMGVRQGALVRCFDDDVLSISIGDEHPDHGSPLCLRNPKAYWPIHEVNFKPAVVNFAEVDCADCIERFKEWGMT